MVSILTQGHVDRDGTLRLEVDTDLPETDVNVRILVEPATEPKRKSDDEWPNGFLDETYGSLAEDPLERLEQGDFEVREAV